MAKQKTTPYQIDWSKFLNNMKVATSSTNATPTNGVNLNLASNGASITFTVETACYALVTSTVGANSTSDFEMKPQIWLDGTMVSQATYSAAAGNASNRINPRTWQAIIALPAGGHTISAGVLVTSATSPGVGGGNAQISGIVLGNVTA